MVRLIPRDGGFFGDARRWDGDVRHPGLHRRDAVHHYHLPPDPCCEAGIEPGEGCITAYRRGQLPAYDYLWPQVMTARP